MWPAGFKACKTHFWIQHGLQLKLLSSVYLETQDDGPNESKDEAMVAVDNVVGSHVLQVDPLLFEKLQGFVHIFQTVDTHSAFSGFWLQRKQNMEKEHLL